MGKVLKEDFIEKCSQGWPLFDPAIKDDR